MITMSSIKPATSQRRRIPQYLLLLFLGVTAPAADPPSAFSGIASGGSLDA
jgi:hypothetical protein